MRKLLLLSVFAVFAANAALIPALDVASAGTVVTVDDVTGETTYSYMYSVTLNPSARLNGDDPENEFFTIYDFAGFDSVASITPPGGWTVEVMGLGETPDGITVPTDDPTLDNLVFRYEGVATSSGAGWLVDIHTNIGPFTTSSYFSSKAANALLEDTHVRNWGEILVPSGTDSGEPGPVPEPLTMGLIGTGLAGMGLLRRYRQS